MAGRGHRLPAHAGQGDLICRVFLPQNRPALPLIRPAIRDGVLVDVEVIGALIEGANVATDFGGAAGSAGAGVFLTDRLTHCGPVHGHGLKGGCHNFGGLLDRAHLALGAGGFQRGVGHQLSFPSFCSAKRFLAYCCGVMPMSSAISICWAVSRTVLGRVPGAVPLRETGAAGGADRRCVT